MERGFRQPENQLYGETVVDKEIYFISPRKTRYRRRGLPRNFYAYISIRSRELVEKRAGGPAIFRGVPNMGIHTEKKTEQGQNKAVETVLSWKHLLYHTGHEYSVPCSHAPNKAGNRMEQE